MISSCEEFVRAWTEESRHLGVQFQNPCLVNSIEKVGHKHSPRPPYRVVCKDGRTYEFDVVIVAAGIRAPLLVSKLGASKFIPTYPLRGFSLTLFAWQEEEKENLLKQPFSCDSMYCTSVTPWMARLAGFGEFIGYPKEDDVPSIGPSVLARYGRAVFPDAVNAKPREVLSCFRPTSPDDVPIAGGISSMPGLFVHNGHGTLGWTLGLATGECVAQEIAESLTGESEGDSTTFELPNGFEVHREVLSPGRFGS
jgi:glycine/D-amino acid oxidase-like deaminating enzyme